ncbi:MAG TPA: sugar phosphate nucleotidyltransferase [Acidimicrobiia bacterium]|nr:sugar phosphate nucleotidyltransferase [Acidimicrobiia bacterium]
MASFVPVILSGGSGTRLWPLSRASSPKQLQALVGTQTMLQATAARVAHLGDLMVIANANQTDRIVAQLPATARVIAEPIGRNTAAAVAAAAFLANPEDLLLVLPADHHIADLEAFRRGVVAAEELARAGHLVTFGIVPTRIETGYGYIVPGNRVESGGRLIERFVEKPDAALAGELVQRGALWNSGMFVFGAGLVLEELAAFQPDLVEYVGLAVKDAVEKDGALLLSADFGRAPAVSVDVAVMERTQRGVVVPLDAGWSDVGSWASLWDLADHNEQGNVITGPVFSLASTGSYVRSEGPLVAVVGVADLVVVATVDAVLVTTRERAQDVKAMVDMLEGRPELQ